MKYFFASIILLLISTDVPAQQIKVTHSANNIIGENIGIRIIELSPNKKYILKTEIIDEWNRKWTSDILFKSDSKGVFNIEKQRPLEGSYVGIDPLGIFWSAQLERTPPAIANGQFPTDSTSVMLTLLKEDEIISTKRIVRWLVLPGVTKREIRENGVIATLYEPLKKKKDIAIILVGGSGGGITWQRVTAGVLASYGYTTMALSYFNMEALPQKLELIPLDYIEKTISIIKQLPGINKDKIGMIGYSRGAELALTAASIFTDIHFVVAFAPSHVVYQSFSPPDFPQTSSWSYKGISLPFVPYTGFKPNLSGKENFTNYLKNDSAVTFAAIPVEKIKGPVLLISGKEDQVWPSEFMANKIIDRLRSQNFKYKFQHNSYDSSGHTIARFGYMPTTQSMNNGGTAKGNAYAQYNGWKALINFLECCTIGK